MGLFNLFKKNEGQPKSEKAKRNMEAAARFSEDLEKRKDDRMIEALEAKEYCIISAEDLLGDLKGKQPILYNQIYQAGFSDGKKSSGDAHKIASEVSAKSKTVIKAKTPETLKERWDASIGVYGGLYTEFGGSYEGCKAYFENTPGADSNICTMAYADTAKAKTSSPDEILKAAWEGKDGAELKAVFGEKGYDSYVAFYKNDTAFTATGKVNIET